MPVVPIAISGTRQMLPSKQYIPRRAHLTIDILPAIAPGDDDFGSSRKLAEASRQSILRVLDEPDLLASDA
jgi:1-acyl-sn-glycerol-3-phosphate acyltransferase